MCLRALGAVLAGGLLHALARDPQTPVLDWGSDLPGDGGEGHVHRRVPEHPQLGQNHSEPNSRRRNCQLCKEVNCKVMKPHHLNSDCDLQYFLENFKIC